MENKISKTNDIPEIKKALKTGTSRCDRNISTNKQAYFVADDNIYTNVRDYK